jgi:hypothetical protein
MNLNLVDVETQALFGDDSRLLGACDLIERARLENVGVLVHWYVGSFVPFRLVCYFVFYLIHLLVLVLFDVFIAFSCSTLSCGYFF